MNTPSSASQHSSEIQLVFNDRAPAFETPLHVTSEVGALKPQLQQERAVDLLPIDALQAGIIGGAVLATAGTITYLKSKPLNRALARHYDAKSIRLTDDADVLEASQAMDNLAAAAETDIDSMLPPHRKHNPSAQGRRQQIIAANPSLAPLNRVGVVDPHTGEIVNGSAFHMGRRNPGDFYGFRRYQTPPRNSEPPARIAYANNKEWKKIVAQNKDRDDIAKIHNEIRRDTNWGPYGEILLDRAALEAFIASQGTKLSTEEARRMRKLAHSIQHEQDHMQHLFHGIEERAHGIDDKVRDLRAKSSKAEQRRDKHRRRS